MKRIKTFLAELESRDIHLQAEDERLQCDAPQGALTAELRAELAQRKPEILQYFRHRRALEQPIPAIPRTDHLPLSFAQQRLWFLDQLEGPSATYNMPIGLRLEGRLDQAVLARSLKEIVARHEVLRSRFALVNGVPVVRIATVDQPLPVIDLRMLPAEAQAAEVERLLNNEARRTFDLATGPLLRTTLLALASDVHILLFNIHHIVCDGWSVGVFIRELAALYQAFSQGRTSPLPPLAVQYVDFAHWQRQWLQGEVLQSQLDYWKNQLADTSALLKLPTDYPRPPVQRFQGRTEYFQLSPRLTAQLKDLGQRRGVTLFMVLLAAFATLLFRYSQQRDLVIGTPIANRTHDQVEPLIGFFVNTLALRVHLEGNSRFLELLKQVRQTALDAYAYQDIPFERLVDELQVERDPSHTPLFQAMFVLQNTPVEELSLAELQVTLLVPENTIAKFDLILNLEEVAEGLKGEWEYNTDLFASATIQRMTGHFRTLLEGIAADPEQCIQALPLLTAAEWQQLQVWNATQVDYLAEQTVIDLFEAQVAKTPEARAVVFEDQHLTYSELNARANQLAHYLQGLGVGPEVRVGLCLERSPELVIGILGILKAGGAYVPLDSGYPAERLSFLLEDAQVPVLLTQAALLEALPPTTALTLCLDGDAARWADCPVTNPPVRVTGVHLAYVIYTSGSTGRPKGVPIPHANITRLFLATAPWFHFTDTDVWTLFHSHAFDFSVWELWGALLHGGRLVIVPYLVSRTPAAFRTLLSEQGVTVLNQTPSAFYNLIQADSGTDTPLALRWVIFGGEALDPARLTPWFARHGDRTPHLVNMYGITETTVHVTCQPLTAMAGPGSRVGRPIPDLRVYLVDRYGWPVPIGVPGELYVGGAGLARGYLNRPGLTAERFVPDLFGGQPGTRLYKTGDLARYQPDGSIEYLGRLDQQVKLRGFRIELGEVKAVLTQHPAVHEAVVIAQVSDRSSASLLAYVVPDRQQAFSVWQLLHFEKLGLLANQAQYELPNGMVIIHKNKSETDFLYREIFAEQCYLQHGITLHEGACIFDVGANIGIFTLFMGQMCENAVIYAFEPIPPLFEILRINTELYGLNVKLFECGLASKATSATFTYYPHVSVVSGRFADPVEEKEVIKSFLLNQQQIEGDDQLLEELLTARLTSERITCPLKTLSDVIRENNVEKIDLLKVDVEKSEWDVLAGLQETDWHKITQVVVEVHDIDNRLDRILALLKGHGYDLKVSQDELLKQSPLYSVFAKRTSKEQQFRGETHNKPDFNSKLTWSSAGHLIGDIRFMLREKLPDYMIPSAFVLLDALPLTPNGKLDHRALPPPEGVRPALEKTYVSPQTALEQDLAEVWQQVLQLDKVGVYDNFFDLGGHSLLTVQVFNALRTRFPELSLVDLFQYPTIHTLAEHLTPSKSREHKVPVLPEVRNSLAQGDIAIIGMACRFPGARDTAAFWQNLRDGIESIRFFSDAELLAAGVDPALVSNPNYVKANAVLEDIDLFDAAFFDYNPREAELLDPQQRLFLECAWEAIEAAGYDVSRIPGAVGVYAGIGANTYYLNNLVSNSDLIASVGHFQAMLNNDKDYLATRVSYKLNLKGPSVGIQTACSTSLVAVHLAVRSLLAGECDLALAGGVSVSARQIEGYLYQEGMILSPDGHCRAFDAQAGGAVSGSGVGCVVLKRLEQALAEGDSIQAVIKGSAINNDGALKVGYTAPSVAGQAAVIAAAMQGLEYDSIGYVEAHGTATPLGDPIEVKALTQAYRRQTEKTGYCALGSVKTNFGHLDTAAGVAGLIKVVLALQHRQLPPSLHYQAPNPQIAFADSPFFVNTALTAWPAAGHPRRAAVSSFGIGGTNAHVVVEEAPPLASPRTCRPWQLLVLSAKSATALEAATVRLAAHLEQHPALELADVAYTLGQGRKLFEQRRIVLAPSTAEAAEALRTVDARVLTQRCTARQRPVAFLFSGQGSQYVNMGLGLYPHEALFREQVDRCAERLEPHLGLDLREVLYPAAEQANEAAERLLQTALAQPALFVLEYALAQLWISWGVQPVAMLGHSLGEYVAACLAGVFSLEDALTLVAARGRLMQALPGGAMLSVPLPEAELTPLLSPVLALAAHNGPATCVVSGPTAAVTDLEHTLRSQGIDGMRLKTSHAFHSAMLEPMQAAFREQVSRLPLHPPQRPYLSNVSGTWITAAEATDPGYWAWHLRQTVRFAEGVKTLLQLPDVVLLEIGPGRTLAGLARQQLDNKSESPVLTSLPTASERQDEQAFLLTTLGRLWLAGGAVDWDGFYGRERRRVPLPPYPFERQRFWVEPATAAASNPASASPAKRADIDAWFYLPSWKRSILPTADAADSGGPWLVFIDEYGLGTRLVERLRRQSAAVTGIRVGTNWAASGAGDYTLNPRQPGDYDNLIGALRALDKTPRTLIHCWNVTAGEEPEDLDKAQTLGFYSLLYLAQALEKQGMTQDIQLLVVSDQLQEVSAADRLCPSKATLLGPVRVIGQEYPNIHCRSLDIAILSGQIDDRLIDQLVKEVTIPSADQVIAYRGRHRWVQTYEPVRLAGNGASGLRERGVYLITGGLGNIGLLFAGYLARTVKARLILTGRSAFPVKEAWSGWLESHAERDPIGRKIRQLQALEAQGTEVWAVGADVADLQQMRMLIVAAEQRFGPLNGVIHAAGLVGEEAFRAIEQTDRAYGERQFQTKVYGTLVLEAVLQDKGLDFCLLLSSLASVLGGLGFTAYAAANAFLDTLVQQHNRQSTVPWLGINWDGWQFEDTGELPGLGTELAIRPQEGIAALQRILSVTPALDRLVVSTGNLQTRQAQWTKQQPDTADREALPQHHSRPNLVSSYVAPRDSLERALADIWQHLLGIDPIGIDDDFFELGGHSLLATQVVSRIQNTCGVKIPLSVFFELATIAKLSEWAVARQLEQMESEAMEKILAEAEALEPGPTDKPDPSREIQGRKLQ
jgi:amino acid adenylation domain-containing protein/FkbM family methyltransferase